MTIPWIATLFSGAGLVCACLLWRTEHRRFKDERADHADTLQKWRGTLDKLGASHRPHRG